MKPSAKIHSSAKIAFEAMLEAGAKWFDWISDSIGFQAMVKDKLRWEDMSSGEVASVQRRLTSSTPEMQVMINSFYITMIAGFEEYLRGVIREVAYAVTQSTSEFEKINAKLRRLNVRESARLLNRIDSPPDYLKLDEVELCRQLGSWIPGSKSCTLNGDALAEIGALLKLENFIDRMDLLGRKVDADYLGSQQSIKDALHMPKAKPREAGKELLEVLETISKYRNRIAHTGGHAADVTQEIAKDHRALLNALANAIDSAI